MKTKKSIGRDDFDGLKHLLLTWCLKEGWGFRMETGEREESFWLTAARNEISEELNARTGLNVFLSPPSLKMRGRAAGRLYAPELPGASAYIIKTAGKWRFIPAKQSENAGRGTGSANDSTLAPDKKKNESGKVDYPLNEAAFKKLISAWLAEFMSGKNFSYKH